MSETQLHFMISGRVQGVGFRRFVSRAAQEHHISGWVSNTDDGAVEVHASGDTANIAQFVQQCRQGPTFAHVTDVQFLSNDLVNKENPPISQGIKVFYIKR